MPVSCQLWQTYLCSNDVFIRYASLVVCHRVNQPRATAYPPYVWQILIRAAGWSATAPLGELQKFRGGGAFEWFGVANQSGLKEGKKAEYKERQVGEREIESKSNVPRPKVYRQRHSGQWRHPVWQKWQQSRWVEQGRHAVWGINWMAWEMASAGSFWETDNCTWASRHWRNMSGNQRQLTSATMVAKNLLTRWELTPLWFLGALSKKLI